MDDSIQLKVNGENMFLKEPILLIKNRYYLPLNEIVKLNGKAIKKTKSSIRVNLFDKDIIIGRSSWHYNGTVSALKKPIINKKNNLYISLIDFTNIFNLDTRWDFEKREISIYRRNEEDNSKKYLGNGMQQGAIRLEDIAVDGTGSKKSSEYLETLRIIGKNLAKREIPYYVAWIPRYIDVDRGIDLDPSNKNSFPIAELVYTLDYLNFNNGFIGLHGYTHQRGEITSGVGIEFGVEYPSIDELKTRVEKALQIAKDLDLEILFFEAPHYNITIEQNRELERKFKYIFNNYNCGIPLDYQKVIEQSPEKRDSYYIPTPLYYVEDRTGENMINRIREFPKDYFAGLFYHPFLEQNLIEFTVDENNIPRAIYKETSILNKIIDELEKKDINLIRFY